MKIYKSCWKTTNQSQLLRFYGQLDNTHKLELLEQIQQSGL